MKIVRGNSSSETTISYFLSPNFLIFLAHLFQNLGNFGPLKCKEIYSLDKLQNQAEIIEKLINIARQGPNVNDLQTGMNILRGSTK